MVALLAAFASLLTACSRAVTWDEEVLLNSGEKIWVHRIDRFERGSEPGNPIKWTWGLGDRQYAFTFRDHAYRYRVPATESPGAMAIAVDGSGTVVVIDHVRSCTKPGLAVFAFVDGAWRMQPRLLHPMFGTKRNLMERESPENGFPPRISLNAKERLEQRPRSAPRVDELYALTAGSECKGRE